MRDLRARLFASLSPLEALYQTRRLGPSQTEGDIMSAVTQRTLGGLAERGVLQSSVTAPAVAAAVAPIENQRQQRVQGLLERLVAARQSILEGTQAPGYGAAFGEALGQGGDLLAYLAGQQYGNRSKNASYDGQDVQTDYQGEDPYANFG